MSKHVDNNMSRNVSGSRKGRNGKNSGIAEIIRVAEDG